MTTDEPSRPSAELETAILESFDAAERLYRATQFEVSRGCPLPADAESASAVAFRVAMKAIQYDLPCPRWAADAVSWGWRRFEFYEVASIADAFGIPDHKHRAAKHDEILASAVYAQVRELQANGVQLKPNARDGKGALTLVGERFHMSGKKVEALITQWRNICRQNGRDPDKPAYELADAKGVVDAAWVKAWQNASNEWFS